LLGLAVALLLVFRRIVRPRLEVTWRTWLPLMQTAAPVGVAVVFGLVLSRIDTAMLAAFKSRTVVGNYGAAYRLFEAPLLVSFGVTAAVYPVFSRLTASTVPPVGVVFGRAVKLAVALTLPVAVGAAILSGPVIELLYGSSFDAAGGALTLLAPALALFPIGYLAAYLLVSQGRQRVLSVVYGLVAAENILANFVLIPLLSLKGAALGTSVSQLLQTAALVYYARQAAGAVDWPRVLGGTVVASVLAGGAMALLRDNLGAAIGAGAAIYIVALMVFEQLAFPQDARALWAFVRRRNADLAVRRRA
jgi:stage V sporulation protein B